MGHGDQGAKAFCSSAGIHACVEMRAVRHVPGASAGAEGRTCELARGNEQLGSELSAWGSISAGKGAAQSLNAVAGTHHRDDLGQVVGGEGFGEGSAGGSAGGQWRPS